MKYTTNVFNFQTYGTVPDRSLLQACDNSCPICHDKLADPVMLTCKVSEIVSTL